MKSTLTKKLKVSNMQWRQQLNGFMNAHPSGTRSARAHVERTV
jgi:hypothetical protein